MLSDEQTTLMDDLDVGSGGAATTVSRSYDLGAPGSDVQGNAAPSDAGLSHLILDNRVTTAFAGGTSCELQVIQSANSDLSSPDVLESTGAIAVATLVVGYKFKINRVPQSITKRYLGTRAITVGATSAGKIRSQIIPNVFA